MYNSQVGTCLRVLQMYGFPMSGRVALAPILPLMFLSRRVRRWSRGHFTTYSLPCLIFPRYDRRRSLDASCRIWSVQSVWVTKRRSSTEKADGYLGRRHGNGTPVSCHPQLRHEGQKTWKTQPSISTVDARLGSSESLTVARPRLFYPCPVLQAQRCRTVDDVLA